MSEATKSPAVDDQEGMSQGHGGDGHDRLLQQQQQQQQQQTPRHHALLPVKDKEALQQDVQNWTGGASAVSLPSPGDVGLEPPVQPRLSPCSAPPYSETTLTLAHLPRSRHSVRGRGNGGTCAMFGTADGPDRSRGTVLPVSTAWELAMRARHGSSVALEDVILPESHQLRHRRGANSQPGNVALVLPASPSTAKNSTQRSLAETALYSDANLCGTVGCQEHLAAETAQRMPVRVNTSLTTATTSATTAGAEMDKGGRRVCQRQCSSPAGLAAGAQAWHWGAVPFQQQHQKGRGRQRRSFAASREGALGRRRGRNAPAPLFSNVPTTAAMGAAVAARAHKSTPSPSTSLGSPAAKALRQRTAQATPISGCTAVFTSSQAMPVVSGEHSGPGHASPAALESSPAHLLNGRGAATTSTPTAELKHAFSDTEAMPMSLTSEVPTAETLLTACAPASSASVPASPAVSVGPYDGTYHLGVPHIFATPDHTGTPLSGPAAGGTAADGAKVEDGVMVVDPADQQHVATMEQPRHGDDGRGDLLRVTSFASRKEGSIYSLVDSRQTSEHTDRLPASVIHEDLGEGTAADTGSRAFTSTKEHTTLLPHGVNDARMQKTEQSRAAADTAGAPVLCGSRRRVDSGGTPSAVVVSGSAEAAPQVRPPLCVATSLEEEALRKQSVESGVSAGMGSVTHEVVPQHSLTAPACMAGMSAVTPSGAPLGSGTSTFPPWSTQQQQRTRNLSLLSTSTTLGQHTTSNSFWCSSSSHVNAVSSDSVTGIAGGVSAVNVDSGGLGSVVYSSTLYASNPFTASVVMQQSKSALIAELKRRRHRLHKQLACLQKEATARNIFALVRASNAAQLQYLLQEGLCNVNDRDYNGCTPLHVAAGEGNEAIVRVLLFFGADVAAVDHSGRAPLDCAAANRHSGVARHLLTAIRRKQLTQEGGDGTATSSGGHGESSTAMQPARRATDKDAVGIGTCPSPCGSSDGHSAARQCTVDTARGILPLDRSTQVDNVAQHQSASSGSSLLLQSPGLLPLPSWKLQQQRRPPISSSSVVSTPSPSRPSNAEQHPAKVTGSITTKETESWSDSDVPPQAGVWGLHSSPAEAAAAHSPPTQASAAAGSTVFSDADPAPTPKPPSFLSIDNISDPVLGSLPQRHVSQQGATAMAKSVGANSTLSRHESVMATSTPPRWRHSSIPHGCSPQRPVFLSSLDSTAAAHSRSLIAAESNVGAATTASSSPPFSSSRSHESTAPLPITLGINGPATSLGNSSASVGGRPQRRPTMSSTTYAADGRDECSSDDTNQTAMQRRPSRTRSSFPLITATPAPAAGAMEGWHDSDEPLMGTDVEGMFDVFFGRRGYYSMHRRRIQSESGSSCHGAFASAPPDWLRGGSAPILSAGVEKQQRIRYDGSSFNETGSFPGEMRNTRGSPPAPTTATGAASATVGTPPTSAGASGGGAQQRQMLLRPPRRPGSRSPATDRGSATTTSDALAYPTRILHPLQLLGVDPNEELGGYLSRTATSMTSSTTTAMPPSGGGSLPGTGAASSSLCDMGQQSFEEHHHHCRMTAFGMLGSQRQLRGRGPFDGRSTPPVQALRVVSESTTMEAAVAGAVSPIGGGSISSSGDSTIPKNGHKDATPSLPVPEAGAGAAVAAPPSPSSPTANSADTANVILAAPSTPATAPAAEERPSLQEMPQEPVDLAELHHSSYATISDTVSVIVCMVGLPGRGKSFISKRLMRYMNWKGVPCKVFNAGNYRRQLLGVEATAGADFFDPDNPQGAKLRERMAELACKDLVNFIASHSLAVGILDATNTTRKRRAWMADYFQQEAQRYAVPYRLLFIESVCTDDAIVTENILRSKCGNDDFRNLKDVSAVTSEFRNRILQYEKVYETLQPEERMPYIKIINVKHHVILHHVPHGLGSRIAFFLLNLHPIAFPIYVALPGETVGDSKHLYGGDERLTAQGEAYAWALRHFIQDRYVPHMVVLHATNYCVLRTLAPLTEGAADDEGKFPCPPPSSPTQHSASTEQEFAVAATASTPLPADAATATGSGPWPPNASSKAAQRPSLVQMLTSASPISSRKMPPPSVDDPFHKPQLYPPPTPTEELRAMAGGDLSMVPPLRSAAHVRRGDGPTAKYESRIEARQGSQQRDGGGLAEECPMHEDDSDTVDADDADVGDEVLCAVPGLDNINFGRFSGHTAAWVKEKYPRLSALLYDMDDDEVVNDATASSAPGESATAATDNAAQHHIDPGYKTYTAAEWLSAPLPPQVHYATHEEAVSHLQRALSGADPRLSYCTQLPNGESCRQVNARLEPALMAVMRTQSPVFVVAPALPAQGILSFFLDVMPELSPTIRIPKGCVIEIGVKDSVTVHPLLPNALPESMARSPLTVLPEIQDAIREVAAANSVGGCTARTCAEVGSSTQAGGSTGGGGAAAAILGDVAAVGKTTDMKDDAGPVSANASRASTAPPRSSRSLGQ
ncbi:6-phosphofructo-2-kinase/fructose-2,6-biphospha ta se,putative [Leishmania tarentolae]|uniref:6-phosphofructo-2-kinase/fructose-2,6-biphospha ta se,putative n=1 Tax=Leishmania tarentolae TaxID=5689 RepID=A0A640K9B8_LEITA|nr:6-phosphofructo-2-kinase/fructose-2,6-biphospha ta se,putative [Leishmania tarentolae]